MASKRTLATDEPLRVDRVNEPNTGYEHQLSPQGRTVVHTFPDGSQRVITPDEARKIVEGLSRTRRSVRAGESKE